MTGCWQKSTMNNFIDVYLDILITTEESIIVVTAQCLHNAHIYKNRAKIYS